eukprot:GHVL01023952.1.p1 GENE.GHVL01023952.1~~GHVL01023952.1.p1  ORF type:complete len:295 (+),score=51.72 GHVL01023952.1:273-1157(+)
MILNQMFGQNWQLCLENVSEDNIYLFGGRGLADALIDLVDYYSISDGVWKTIPTTNNWLTATSDLAAVTLNDMTIALIGGYTSDYTPSSQTIIFDPTTLVYENGPILNTARGDLGAILVDGVIYTIGGFTGECDPQNVVETWTPPSTSWVIKSPMTIKRGDKAVGEIDGNIFIVGGETKLMSNCKTSLALSDVEKYSPTADEWTQATLLPSNRMRASAASWNQNILLFGGQIDKLDINNMHASISSVMMFRACDDNIQNFDETGVDCGGSCGVCSYSIITVPSVSLLLLFSLIF